MSSASARLADQAWLRSASLGRLFDAFPADGLRCVGGCIRDSLAGLEVKDVDLATPLPPDSVIARLRAAAIHLVPTGLKHGTVTAVIGHQPFEITTLRRDVETDGRHAEVAFIDDWQADAARRDLTINAIYCDRGGVLFDPFDGAGDLAAGRVRFVGDARARITEDYLRLLRYFRFHARYGRGAPDAAAIDAARDLAPGLVRLSAERVHDELKKLLAGPRVGETLALMAEAGILPHIDPAVRAVDRLGRLVSVEEVASRASPGIGVDPVRRMAALLDPSDPDVGARLRFSRKEIARIGAAQAREPVMTADADRRARRSLIFDLGPEIYRDRCLLAWADDRAVPDGPVADRWLAQLAEADTWHPPRFPVDGRDALAIGLATGPEVGVALDRVRDWWRDGGFAADRAACLARLRTVAAEPAEATGQADGPVRG